MPAAGFYHFRFCTAARKTLPSYENHFLTLDLEFYLGDEKFLDLPRYPDPRQNGPGSSLALT